MTKKTLFLALFAFLLPGIASADVFPTDTASADSASTNFTIPFVRRGERGWDDRLNDGLFRIDQVLKIISNDMTTSTGDFLGLSDTPNSYAGEGGKYVRVNVGASGLEFTAAGVGGDMASATWDSDSNSAIDVDNGGTNAIDGWTIISNDVTLLSDDVAIISRDIGIISRDIAIISDDVEIMSRDIGIISRDIAFAIAPTYITQTANGTLTNEQALSALATGIVKNTTTTGILSIAADGTDYLAPSRIDDTKGNGDTGYVWSADKVFDQLALKQAADADLTTYAGITPSANIQTLLGSADFAAARTNLGLAIGTNVQAFDADLTTYAGITPSANAQTLLGETFAQMQASLSIDDLITLSGMAEGSVNLSTFTGSTIADNVTIKAALQALETALELKTPVNNATQTGTFGVANDINISGARHSWRISVVNPNAVVTASTIIPIGEMDANITVTKIVATTSSASYEIAGDLKYADARIGLANAVVVNDFDTTSGVRTDTTITSAAIASGKFAYLLFDSAPNALMTDCEITVYFDYD